MYGFTFPSSYITTPKYLYCDVRYIISLDGVVHWCCIGVPRDGYMATTSVLSLLQFTVSRHFLQYAYIILVLCCTPFSTITLTPLVRPYETSVRRVLVLTTINGV